jgi:DNA-binding ferritin-like protein (Dps family)
MKDIRDYLVNEARVDWRNVHDAILNVLMKYCRNYMNNKEINDYCNKVRDALDKIH